MAASLSTLYTCVFTSTHSSSVIIKFTDDTMLLGLILDCDQMVEKLSSERYHNNSGLNVCICEKMVVDFRRKKQRSHATRLRMNEPQ